MTLTTNPDRPRQSTLTEPCPCNKPYCAASNAARLRRGEPAVDIAPGAPRRLYPVNPWLPWVNRVGGATIGVCLAAACTFLLGNGGYWQVAAAVIAGMVFAFVVFGHEQCAKRPARFTTEAP